MTSTLLRTAPGLPGCRRRGVSASLQVVDLEEFWPSRRGHAFDERCR